MSRLFHVKIDAVLIHFILYIIYGRLYIDAHKSFKEYMYTVLVFKESFF